MNFCTCGVIFVLLAKLKRKLWQHKVEKTWRFLCADMFDFCRPGHNYACLQALVNNMLTWQSSCVIVNKKTAKAICPRP